MTDKDDEEVDGSAEGGTSQTEDVDGSAEGGTSQTEESGEDMRALLKRSLEPASPDKPMLREVQRKIRLRSKGKFYADGWSTAQSRVSYALVAGVMLLIVAIAYFVLGPMGFTNR